MLILCGKNEQKPLSAKRASNVLRQFLANGTQLAVKAFRESEGGNWTGI
jgi:hypothetical protein